MPRGLTNRVLTKVVDDGRLAQSPDELAVEEPLEIRIDGHVVGTTMRTPGHDFELAVGFCQAEGLLDHAPVLATKYCRDGGPGAVVESEFNVVTVDTGGVAPVPEPRIGTTTSACGLCGATVVDALRQRIHALPRGDVLPLDVVVGAPDALLTDTPIFAATGAVHAAALFDASGSAVAVREDVGRHNAVDKVVGRLVLDGRIPARGLGLAVSGRIGFEIVQKAWSAGIETVVAKGAPTALAVQAARLGDLAVVGWARGGDARIYVGDDRW